MVIVDGPLADPVLAALAEDRIGRFHGALLERRRHEDGLERRARLEGVGHGAVAPGSHDRDAGLVRVVGGDVRESEHLAALGIEQHRRAGLGTRLLDADREFALDERLQTRVDREREGCSGREGPLLGVTRFDVVAFVLGDHQGTPESVALHPQHRLRAAHPAVVAQLDSLESAQVRTREAHHVGSDGALRIDPPPLGHRADAEDGELRDRAGLVVGDAALEPDESARRIELAVEHPRGDAERLRQRGAHLRSDRVFARARVDRRGGHRLREDLAEAVEDRAAHRGEAHCLAVLSTRAAREIGMVEDRQLGDPGADEHENGDHRPCDERDPIAPRAGRRRDAHGTTTCPGAGACSPRRTAARSMRAGAVAAASSIVNSCTC